MDERRRSHRSAVSFPVRYRPIGTALVDDVVDISETGMFLSCEEPLSLGTRIELDFPEGRNQTLRVEAEVVRVVWGGRSHGEKTSAGMGVRFEKLTETRATRLRRIIHDFEQAKAG